MPAETIALITGANKGIGFEVATRLTEGSVFVLIGARDETRARGAVDALLAQGLHAAHAKELRAIGIKVNAADPGFTATHFNNHRGYRTVKQAAVVVVRLATLAADGPTGTFQDENGLVPW